MSQNRDDASRCRYCGEKLSLIQRLSRAEFCNARHKESYHRDQDHLAISRLQQLVIEEREAELHGRLRGAPAASDEGSWPEEEQEQIVLTAPAPAAAAPSAPARPPKAKTDKGSGEPGPPLCGVVFEDSLAAIGRRLPQTVEHRAEDLAFLHRVPEFEASTQSPRLEPAGQHRFNFRVDTQLGDQQGVKPDVVAEAPAGGFRFPGLSVKAEDWREALQRLRESYAGIPPLAGLIQIAGPQTLRFEARLRSLLPQPVQPLSQPVRSYKPGLARGAAVPGLAGAISGLGTWRTRFGSEGAMSPLWSGDVMDMTVAADWMPRYPVFYTISPWDREGFEAAFGLGPGRGEGPGGDGVDVGQPGGVMAVLNRIEEEAPRATAVSPVEPPRATAKQPEATPASTSLVAKTIAGVDTQRQQQQKKQQQQQQTAAPSAAAGKSSQGGGSGPGFLKARATGNGVGDGAGTGTGDGRGSVSIDSVAALIKAARQSDRSRTPLRDLDVRLLNYPAAPKMAAPQPWRGLTEGTARDLPERGPAWVKVPVELRLVSVKPENADVFEPPVPSPAPDTILAKRPELPVVLPSLRLSLECPWPAAWLSAVTGQRARRAVAPRAEADRPTVNIPAFAAPPLVFGRASGVQPPVSLPEPWVRLQERDCAPAAVQLTPTGSKGETRRPGVSAPQPGESSTRLSYCRIERPGGQWVLMRGSNETATFRLALDHLGPQESSRAAERTRLGPVARHAPGPGCAAIPRARGIVFRDLVLQRDAAEPWLEPVACQFGSVRGGVWESRK